MTKEEFNSLKSGLRLKRLELRVNNLCSTVKIMAYHIELLTEGKTPPKLDLSVLDKDKELLEKKPIPPKPMKIIPPEQADAMS
jgi:hypothetical protein